MARKKLNHVPRQLTAAMLVQLDFEPLKEMVHLYEHGDVTDYEKFRMADIICSYVYAKPKAIEQKHEETHKIKVVIGGTD